MNLLPIPVLDGGEIFVLLVEWISRKDFSIETKMKVKIVGFFFLIGLMGVVIVNDIFKIFV
jgi:regulator of sigma E protease